MADETLTDEQLDAMDYVIRRAYETREGSVAQCRASEALDDLQAAYKRLRAREAAAMAIVRDVAQNDMVIPLRGSARCVFWDCEYDGISDHSPNCPWMKARALLAQE